MLGSRKNEGKNKIPSRLLDRVADLNSVPLQFELVSIHVHVQVKILILIALTVNEKTALRISFAEFDFEHIYSLSQRNRLKVMSSRHKEDVSLSYNEYTGI